jgi:peptide deformylase
MSNLEIIHLGHPKLRRKSLAVTKRELKTKRFQDFIDDLCTICDANNGAGIAAPQVGVNKRVIVVHVDPKNPRYPDKKPFPLTVVINPRITKRSKTLEEAWEGDLSANLRAKVPRPDSCTVEGLDRDGNKVAFDLDYSFHARVFQHEIDHLSGVMMIDRVKRKETICELPEWEKYWKDKEDEPI